VNGNAIAVPPHEILLTEPHPQDWIEERQRPRTHFTLLEMNEEAR
jgi:hypothetical protein